MAASVGKNRSGSRGQHPGGPRTTRGKGMDRWAHVEAVATDPYAQRRGSASKARQAIYLLVGIIEGLIAIRFILRLLGANPGAGFAAFVYGLTAPLLGPFVGLFGTPQYNGSVLELHS